MSSAIVHDNPISDVVDSNDDDYDDRGDYAYGYGYDAERMKDKDRLKSREIDTTPGGVDHGVMKPLSFYIECLHWSDSLKNKYDFVEITGTVSPSNENGSDSNDDGDSGVARAHMLKLNNLSRLIFLSSNTFA